MSTVIIVDSACDLPEQITQSKSVAVLPLNIILGEEQHRDRFRASQRVNMLSNGTLDMKHRAESAPASREQIVEFLTKEILPKYDFGIVQSVARVRSPQYEMWQEVNMSFAAHYHEYSQSSKNFTLRIMDSGTMFAGQGLMALNTLYQGQQKVSRRELLERSKQFAEHLQSYTAIADVQYVRERGRAKGERSVSMLSAMIGKALHITPILFGGQNKTEAVGKVKGMEKAVDKMIDHAITCIHSGLQSPLINISYGGEVAELERFSKLRELREIAKEHKVKLFTSTATMSSLINMGPGTFSLAVAPKDPTLRLRE